MRIRLSELREIVRSEVRRVMSEGKKEDLDGNGENDFTDVLIARMMASGMSKKEAIAKAKKKSTKNERAGTRAGIFSESL